MVGRRGFGAALAMTASVATALTMGATVPAQAAVGATASGSVAAPGAPGALSHFDLARKDCLGTARNTTSKIWYTVADGVLSDVYAPTIDTTNVQTMQYLVTDGSSFTDLQTRDMTYTVNADPSGMMCTVTSTARSGAYQLISTYLTDPARDSVVVHTVYRPRTPAARDYHVYVRLDATAGGNGGGGAGNGGADSATVDTSTGTPVPVSYDTQTRTNAVNRDYAVPSYLALRADRPFRAVSSGFVGTASDGLTQLDESHTLAPTYRDATGGNVEQTAELRLDSDHATTLALGFGTTQAAAVQTASETLATPLGALEGRYQAGWRQYDAHLRRPSRHLPGLTLQQQRAAEREYLVSANVLKAGEDKTFAGAIVASMASPWGQAVSAGDPNNTYFGSYREVFARDLYEAFTGLLTDGDLATARAATRFLLLRQQRPDGSMPRNSLLNGKVAPDSFNTQLDEAAYPILMVQQSGLAGDDTLWPHVRAAADFLIAHGPSYGVERWEEQSGYSPSTIAAEIAGLVAAGAIARQHGDQADARVWLATADAYQRNVKRWTVTTDGPLSTKPYFIRLSKTGDPNAAISYNLGNGSVSLDQRRVIDAGFQELVRLGELPADDPDVANSLAVVDRTIARSTPSGTGFLRYNDDGYGDCSQPSVTSCSPDGAPWAATDTGTGHVWPVLAGERGEQDLAGGDPAAAGRMLASIDAMSAGVGLVPEQAWDDPGLAASPYGSDPRTASIGFIDGQPDGSASPLTWGAAAQVRLVDDLTAGRVLERPAITTDRYVRHTQTSTPLTVTAPTDRSATGTGTVTVTGTAAPNATIDVAAVAVDHDDTTRTTSATAGADGGFELAVPVASGTNTLVVTSTAPDGGTAQVVRTVVSDVVNGTLLLDATDPAGDDHGPGNYAYPTASDFHPGAFDLTGFQVYDTGDTVTFRARTRDLTPTFGSPLGAQLLDVYVHEPDAADTSTAPSWTTADNPTGAAMNYRIAAPDAWSRLIEVQGFGQRFVDASKNTVGTVQISANQISRYITFSVSKSALGGVPGPGWAFTVTLTGQDGTHGPGSAQTRFFTSTPNPYSFGVCAEPSSDALCTADPNSVPKVMDTITPAGVSQSGELNYTQHTPVVLQGVRIPAG